MDYWPTERFTTYSPYTIYMRSSNEAPSRHARYRATLVKDPKAARSETEEALLGEKLDTAWIAALNSPEQDADGGTSEGEGQYASGSEMELEDTATSEVEEDARMEIQGPASKIKRATVMEMVASAGGVANAAGMILGAARTMDDTPLSIRLKTTQKPVSDQHEQPVDKQTRRDRAVDYLAKRWGRDITTWIPADCPYRSEKFRSPNKWPAGVLEGLAELAKLTTDTSKRQQAMQFLEEAVEDRIRKTPKHVTANEVDHVIKKAKKAWRPVSYAYSGGDTVELVPLQQPVDQQNTSADSFNIDDDIMQMDLSTLRTELQKTRRKIKGA